MGNPGPEEVSLESARTVAGAASCSDSGQVESTAEAVEEGSCASDADSEAFAADLANNPFALALAIDESVGAILRL